MQENISSYKRKISQQRGKNVFHDIERGNRAFPSKQGETRNDNYVTHKVGWMASIR